MKVLLTLVFAASLASAQMINTNITTKNTSFRISSFGDFGSRVYYNCDSVESVVESMLTDFGAQNVSVRCSGGLNPWGGFATEAFVRVEMDVMTENNDGAMRGEYQVVEIKSSQSCHLYREVAKNTHGLFNVKSLTYTKRCSPSFDRFKLQGEFLK